MATAYCDCVLFKAGEVEDNFTVFSSESAATACAPTAPFYEPGIGDNVCSTLRDELQLFLKPRIWKYVIRAALENIRA
jgi:hypothetical protein